MKTKTKMIAILCVLTLAIQPATAAIGNLLGLSGFDETNAGTPTDPFELLYDSNEQLASEIDAQGCNCKL
jgi:hypothetical protein